MAQQGYIEEEAPAATYIQWMPQVWGLNLEHEHEHYPYFGRRPVYDPSYVYWNGMGGFYQPETGATFSPYPMGHPFSTVDNLEKKSVFDGMFGGVFAIGDWGEHTQP